jgi:hypothetical protein
MSLPDIENFFWQFSLQAHTEQASFFNCILPPYTVSAYKMKYITPETKNTCGWRHFAPGILAKKSRNSTPESNIPRDRKQ